MNEKKISWTFGKIFKQNSPFSSVIVLTYPVLKKQPSVLALKVL